MGLIYLWLQVCLNLETHLASNIALYGIEFTSCSPVQVFWTWKAAQSEEQRQQTASHSILKALLHNFWIDAIVDGITCPEYQNLPVSVTVYFNLSIFWFKHWNTWIPETLNLFSFLPHSQCRFSSILESRTGYASDVPHWKSRYTLFRSHPVPDRVSCDCGCEKYIFKLKKIY